MEQAWELEEALWAAAATGEVTNFYAHTLSDDAIVIGAGYRLRRTDVIKNCTYRSTSLTEYALSDRETHQVAPDTQILTYRILARGPDLPTDYAAQISCVYVRSATGWNLAMRQHTPDPVVDVSAIRPVPEVDLELDYLMTTEFDVPRDGR